MTLVIRGTLLKKTYHDRKDSRDYSLPTFYFYMQDAYEAYEKMCKITGEKQLSKSEWLSEAVEYTAE